MTLLVTVFAAVISTAVWYGLSAGKKNTWLTEKLCFMYWGAALMWLVDAAVGYSESGAAYFNPAPADMLNDLFLGLCVTALGLVIWIAALLIKDPCGVVRAAVSSSAKK